MVAPTSIDNTIKLPVVADEIMYHDRDSQDKFILLTAAVSNLSSQVAQLSASMGNNTREPENRMTHCDRERGQVRAKPSAARRRRIAPYRKQQQCSRFYLKFCQGNRLCVAFSKTCRKYGKMGRFQICCHTQAKNYFNVKH